MLIRLTQLIIRYRWAVIGAWLLLTVVGGFAAAKVSHRWLQSFSIPGHSAYDANQRTLARFGTGMRPPNVVVFHTSGDATRSSAIRAAIGRAAQANPGARTSSFFSTGSLAYLSRDHHTTFMEIYPPGTASFATNSRAPATRKAAADGLTAGISVHVTGHDPIEEASSRGTDGGPGVLVEAVIGGLGALAILLFVFGTLPAVLMPIAVAVAAILNTFTLVWALTYLTDVSIVVQFLIALVGLGIAIDYALLMIFRFRDELRDGENPEAALVQMMTHAGRSVIVSGSTVAVGLLSLIALPVPFIRSIGVGGMLIPAVSVIAAVTLLPAMLAVLGERINSVRVIPQRWIGRDHPEHGAWGRWARLVNRRPLTAALAGIPVVAALAAMGTQLHPDEAQLKSFPGHGDAITGRDQLIAAGISPGVMKPFDVLVDNGVNPAPIAATLRTVPGVADAVAPPAWRSGSDAIVEAFPAIDSADGAIQTVIDRVHATLKGTSATLGGTAAADRDLVHAIYDNFPYLLAFVIILTLILLTRAFRSIVLAVKAALLNLISLAAAFGVIVIIFQNGHGSALWNIDAIHAINAWIPLLIFAFLFGLSMDYEVFMLSRIREAYDQTGSTERAIELGLARTGKLVTSGALILMFAFLVLSTSPGFEVKELAIGLAAGIIIDATLIRALLVPALIRLLGNANWWTPHRNTRSSAYPNATTARSPQCRSAEPDVS